jgi:hypothetical protein
MNRKNSETSSKFSCCFRVILVIHDLTVVLSGWEIIGNPVPLSICDGSRTENSENPNEKGF